MTTKAALATIADLEQHPGRAELIHGELIEMSPTGFAHARVTLIIGSLLRTFVKGHAVPGEVLVGDPGFIWDEQNVRAPDVAYLDAEQVSRAPERGFMPFSPALAIEVVSPGDRWTEVRAKVRGWLAHGTRMVWIVDPCDHTVEVVVLGTASPRELTVADTIDGGAVVPGFSVQVSEFFA